MDTYKEVLQDGLTKFEAWEMVLDSERLFLEWVGWMMANTQPRPDYILFNDLNEAHRVKDRDAVKREMRKLIAQCDAID